MTAYGRQGGRGLNHILAEALECDRGIAMCGAGIEAIEADSVPAGTVCPSCLAHQPKPEGVTVAKRTQRLFISLPQASKECGLALSSLQQAARLGRLKTDNPSPKVRLTTRRWLQDYLDSRPERFKKRQASVTRR